MGKYQIEFYVKENGDVPAEKFIRTLNEKMAAKILRVLDILEINGPLARMPYSRMLDDGIFEIRVQQGGNITRVLYFFHVDKKIILTHGFFKKTQKTPSCEIDRARKYRADYERRCRK